MVLKEGRVIFVGILMAMLLIVANGAYFFLTNEDSVSIISGDSVKDVVSKFYEASTMNQRISILLQFSLLILFVIIVLVIIKKVRSKIRLSKSDFVQKGRSSSKTDLDILYDMLKREKEISIDDISKIFKVNSEVSLEWSKVLEGGNLAIIDYPRFGKPLLVLAEKDNGDLEDNCAGDVSKNKISLKKEDIETKILTQEKVLDEKSKIEKINTKIKKIDKKTKKVSRKINKNKKISKKPKIKKPKKK